MFCNLCGDNIPNGSPRCKKCGNFFPENLGERNYKVILSSFQDYNSKKEIAKYLASQTKNASLKAIMERMDELPLVLMKDVTRQKALKTGKTFKGLGARVKFVPVIRRAEDKKELIEELKRPLKRSYLEGKPLEIPKVVEELETDARRFKIDWRLFVVFGTIIVVCLLFFTLMKAMKKEIESQTRTNDTELPHVKPEGPPVTVPSPGPESPPLKEETNDMKPPGDDKSKATPIIIPEINPSDELNLEGANFFNEGKYDEALDKFIEALKSSPNDLTTKMYVARACTALGWEELKEDNLDEAKKHFETALTYYTNEYQTHYGLGRIMRLRGDLNAAEEFYRETIKLRPDNPDVKLELSITLYNKNELEEALRLLKELEEDNPGNDMVAYYIDKLNRENEVEGSFDIREGEHFDIMYKGPTRDAVGQFLLPTLEMAYIKVGIALGHYPVNKITAVLYTEEEFRDATLIPEWAGAIYDGKIRIPVKGLTGNTERLSDIVLHEYTHAVIYDIAGLNCPVWLHEGLAQYMERMPIDDADDVVIEYFDYYGDESHKTLRDLEESFLGMTTEMAYVAYSMSLSATHYLIKKYNIIQVQNILKDLGDGNSIDEAFKNNLFISYDEFSNRWEEYLKGK